MKRSETARGWWKCCRVYYAGFGWEKTKPPCPTCGSRMKPRQASRADVDRAEEAE